MIMVLHNTILIKFIGIDKLKDEWCQFSGLDTRW